jgi:hypothetical protein
MDLSLQNIHMNMNYGLGELAPSYQVLKNRSKDFKWAWNLVNMYQAQTLEQYCHPRSHCFDLVLGKFRVEESRVDFLSVSSVEKNLPNFVYAVLSRKKEALQILSKYQMSNGDSWRESKSIDKFLLF